MENKEPESREKKTETDPPASSDGRKVWEDPKLAFVEPRLTKHGKLEKITRGANGFFGVFSP